MNVVCPGDPRHAMLASAADAGHQAIIDHLTVSDDLINDFTSVVLVMLNGIADTLRHNGLPDQVAQLRAAAIRAVDTQNDMLGPRGRQ